MGATKVSERHPAMAPCTSMSESVTLRVATTGGPRKVTATRRPSGVVTLSCDCERLDCAHLRAVLTPTSGRYVLGIDADALATVRAWLADPATPAVQLRRVA